MNDKVSMFDLAHECCEVKIGYLKTSILYESFLAFFVVKNGIRIYHFHQFYCGLH